MSGERGVDGVDGPDAVVAAGDQVGAHAAVAGQGSQRVPVPGDGLVPFWSLDGLFAGVVRPSRRLHVMRGVGSIRIWCASRTGSIRCPAARLSS